MSAVGGLVSFIDRLARFSTTEWRLAVTALILLVVLAGGVAARYLRRKARERFHSHVADVVLAGSVGVVVLGAAVALLVLWGVATDVANAWEQIGGTLGAGFRFLLALVVLAGAYVVNGFVQRAIDRFTEGHETITEHQSEIVYRVSQLTVWVGAVAVILGMWNVDLSGLIVGAGFLGIVVGMAARQTLGALLAGFVLMFSRPFEIGDWVEIDGEEGIVTDISIVNTRIQTFAGEYVMIPNDIVSGEKIVNKSRKGRLRIEVEVGVDYEADVERAAALAEETMKDLDEVLTVPTPQVVLKEFGDSAVTLLLRFWIDKPSARRQWRARTAVIESVKETFDREGVKIPFPQRELTGREESGGFRLSGESAAPEPTADGGVTDDTEEMNRGTGEVTDE
ncbi:mechanosensitive ion channel family protein [Halorussus sp. AFM4]|uniref:mechanosensitive ion channel family protein n=1 Tax=Halorussus sp. AFM4 TaxID=3421651 RepID=UPI003EBDB2A0